MYIHIYIVCMCVYVCVRVCVYLKIVLGIAGTDDVTQLLASQGRDQNHGAQEHHL